jgi:hypothetical protein
MQNFMFLIREDMAQLRELSEEQMQADIQEYTQWVEELTKSGHFISGDPLEPEGRYLTKDNIQTDGPFIESKEAITGYILIKAATLDEAIALAKGCPVFSYGGALEVRPVMKF